MWRIISSLFPPSQTEFKIVIDKLLCVEHILLIPDIKYIIKHNLFILEVVKTITPPDNAIFKNGKYIDSQGIVFRTYGGPPFTLYKQDIIATALKLGKMDGCKYNIDTIDYFTKDKRMIWIDFKESYIQKPAMYLKYNSFQGIIEFPVFMGKITIDHIDSIECDINTL